jgi:hypothetical protein
MKHTFRRRRALRPRPTRSQITHTLRQLQRTLNLVRVEAALELNRPAPCAAHMQWLERRALECHDAIAAVENY